MNKYEQSKKTGFINEEERQLYKDVCCDDPIIGGPQSLEELLYTLKNDIEEQEPTKEDFELYIKENNLTDLLNKVRGLPLYNRLLEIYVFNANGLSIATSLEEKVLSDINEAKELFDGEKEQELNKRLSSVRHFKHNYFNAMRYISNQTLRLSPEERLNFYESTNEIVKIAYRENDNPRGIQK